jgi:tRNA(fMet)-specific endonuclease VapC
VKRYLLDSNALNNYVARRRDVYDHAQRARQAGALVGTCTPVLGEFLGGVSHSNNPPQNLKVANRALSILKCWPYNEAAAREYARLYAAMRAVGVKIQEIDLMAAAIARLLPDCTVVTEDTDFDRVPGLRVENWAL